MTSRTPHSKRCTARRRFVVWLTHAPGLWLFYGETVPPRLRAANAIAAGATLLAVIVAAVVADAGHRLIAGLTVWLVGHAAWGSYFAWRLPERDDQRGEHLAREPPVRVRALRCDGVCGPRSQDDDAGHRR